MIGLIDAHSHATDAHFVWQQKELGIRSVINAENPTHLAELNQWQTPLISGGIHPWHTDTATTAMMTQLIAQTPVTGEIGLDTVWTKVPLATQLPWFKRQLDMADALQHPVIIHTKGAELLTAHLLQQHKGPFLIHWYSALTGLDQFLALPTYFSIGPDLMTDVAVQQVLRKVPLSRLLVESDGLESIYWATGQHQDYHETLLALYQQIAAVKHVSVSVVMKQLAINFEKFLHPVD